MSARTVSSVTDNASGDVGNDSPAQVAAPSSPVPNPHASTAVSAPPSAPSAFTAVLPGTGPSGSAHVALSKRTSGGGTAGASSNKLVK